MLTCPSCHHVLAASSCCCGCVTLLPAAAPATHTHTPATHTPAPQTHAPGVSVSGVSVSGASLGAQLRVGPRLAPFQHHHHHHHQQQHQTPLATPHISGHMFHFPAVGGSSLLCQPQIHSPCVMSCQSPAVCSGEFRWPDSVSPALPHPTLSARMHTSGGGIVDEVAKLGTGGVGCVGVGGVGCVGEGGGVLGHGMGCGGQGSGVLGHSEDMCLVATRRALLESGWYWERVSWREAETLLHNTSLGTFLVRDSADSRFLFSLSVQTERGPTSVRVHYAQGRFRLDCEAAVTTTMPDFPHLISLVEYYIRLNRKLNRHVWVDAKGIVFSPITIRQPLKRWVPSLKHLSRLAINLTCAAPTTTLSLPPALCQYLKDYPFWC